eukprot:1184915-Prorocentrum_minimum.AAC.2
MKLARRPRDVDHATTRMRVRTRAPNSNQSDAGSAGIFSRWTNRTQASSHVKVHPLTAHAIIDAGQATAFHDVRSQSAAPPTTVEIPIRHPLLLYCTRRLPPISGFGLL